MLHGALNISHSCIYTENTKVYDWNETKILSLLYRQLVYYISVNWEIM